MTIVAPPVRDAVVDRLIGTTASVSDLEALWAAPPLPSGDDLAAVVAAMPVSRRHGQDETWDSATWTARAKWSHGGLLLDGERRGYAAFQSTAEGRTFSFTATLGTLEVACHDQARRERALAADHARRQRDVDLFVALVEQEGLERAREIADATFGRSITEWSRKSRSRMVRTFASLDYSRMSDIDGDGAMVTLTYPGDFLAVAATGDVAKAHLQAFWKRWARDVGTPWVGLWKQEFQSPRAEGGTSGSSAGQEAPHFHLYCKVPVRVKGLPFTTWLSQTWAKVVGASAATGEYQRHLAAGTRVDFGKASRMTDAKRLAIYFLKHGTKTQDGKEYQHNVPAAWQRPGDGPGRFWGYRGLPKPLALVEVDERDFFTARRVLRRMTRAHGRHVAYQRARGAALDAGRGSAEASRLGMAARVPDVWTLGSSGSLSGGWVLVNDGVRAALDLAHFLTGGSPRGSFADVS